MMMSPKADTHRDLLRRLTTAEKQALTNRSNIHGCLRLAGHLGLIAVMVWLNAGLSSVWQVLAMVGQGIAMVFLFTAMHECSHGTAFRTRVINRVVGWFAGMVLMIGPRWFFYFHQDHHKFTQDPARDPELATPKPDNVTAYLWYLSGVPFWAGNLRVLIGNVAGRRDDSYIPNAMRRAVISEARWMLMIYALIIPVLILNGLFLQFLVLPLLLGQPFLRAYLLAEHAGCDGGSGNMLANTRTLMTSAPVRFLAWNMPYHTEHHSFPAVPFHALPRLHRMMRDDVAHLSPGYLSFHRWFTGRLGAKPESLAEDR